MDVFHPLRLRVIVRYLVIDFTGRYMHMTPLLLTSRSCPSCTRPRPSASATLLIISSENFYVHTYIHDRTREGRGEALRPLTGEKKRVDTVSRPRFLFERLPRRTVYKINLNMDN